jgi:hypothetical protein
MEDKLDFYTSRQKAELIQKNFPEGVITLIDAEGMVDLTRVEVSRNEVIQWASGYKSIT